MAKKTKQFLADLGKGLDVWEIIAHLLNNEDAWGDDLPREINPWQASQVLLTLIRSGNPPESQRRRLALAVIENAAINADGSECCTLAAQIIRQLEGETFLQDAIAKERDEERQRNLQDLQTKLSA